MPHKWPNCSLIRNNVCIHKYTGCLYTWLRAIKINNSLLLSQSVCVLCSLCWKCNDTIRADVGERNNLRWITFTRCPWNFIYTLIYRRRCVSIVCVCVYTRVIVCLIPHSLSWTNIFNSICLLKHTKKHNKFIGAHISANFTLKKKVHFIYHIYVYK